MYDEYWDVKQVLRLILIILIAGGFTFAGIGIIYYILIILQIAYLYNHDYCYIATMVYHSYDAPEVLVLRKFRDEKLALYFWGRVFIRFYYTLSPLFVKVFKYNKPVNLLSNQFR